MKQYLTWFAAVLLGFTVSVANAEDDEKYAEAMAAFKESGQVSEFFNSAYGYALFPTIGKAGIGIGGAHGKGRVYSQGKHVGNASMTQLSFGAQLGGGRRLAK